MSWTGSIFDALSPTLRATAAIVTPSQTLRGAETAPGSSRPVGSDRSDLGRAAVATVARVVRRHRARIAACPSSVQDGSESSTSPQDALVSRPELREAVDRAGRRTAVSLSPDERLAVVGYAEGAVRLWDVGARSKCETFQRIARRHRRRSAATVDPLSRRARITTRGSRTSRAAAAVPHSRNRERRRLQRRRPVGRIAGPARPVSSKRRRGERMPLLAGEDLILTAIAFSQPVAYRHGRKHRRGSSTTVALRRRTSS